MNAVFYRLTAIHRRPEDKIIAVTRPDRRRSGIKPTPRSRSSDPWPDPVQAAASEPVEHQSPPELAGRTEF